MKIVTIEGNTPYELRNNINGFLEDNQLIESELKNINIVSDTQSIKWFAFLTLNMI